MNNFSKLGAAAWGFRETPLAKQVKEVKELGLEILELQIASHPNDFIQLDAGEEEVKRVKEIFQGAGIALLCASTGNDFTCPEKEQTIKNLGKVMKVVELAGKFGIEYLRIFAGFSPRSEIPHGGARWRLMMDCLRESANFAESRGVKLAIETHGWVSREKNAVRHHPTVTTDIGSLVKISEELPRNCGFNFDPANLAAAGVVNPGEFYKKIGEKVFCMHLKDFSSIDGDGLLEPVACGDGILEWPALLDAIKDFSGPMLIEYENTSDVIVGMKKSAEFLSKSGLCVFVS